MPENVFVNLNENKEIRHIFLSAMVHLNIKGMFLK
jgi:hypothetical protein